MKGRMRMEKEGGQGEQGEQGMGMPLFFILMFRLLGAKSYRS